MGEDVISVSGSDAHGTPILIAAEQTHQTPSEFVENKHAEFVEVLKQWSIELDNYTVTTTDSHKEFVREFYTDLYHNGKIEKKTTHQYYCSNCSKFLPDRFVIGVCPKCNTNQARGDQCSNDDCNTPLTPEEIIEPKCATCHLKPNLKETIHWYFKLKDAQDYLSKFLSNGVQISDKFRNEALAFVNRGLENRALTRDLSWGIQASDIFDSEQEKVFYVWSEDVLGYISASIEKYKSQNRDWEEIWKKAKTVFCIGKDNLFFHAIWYPALIEASGFDYVAPKVISITNFLQFNGQGFSKSKGIGIWADEALSIAPSDYWRFYLVYSRPDNKDGNFTYYDFVETVNKHLVNTIGNLVVRSISLIHKLKDGLIQKVTPICEVNKLFLISFEEIEYQTINKIYECDIRGVSESVVQIARFINQHIVDTSPWKSDDDGFIAESLYTIYWSLVRLSYWLKPLTPHIATDLRTQLGLLKQDQFEDSYISFRPPKLIPERSFFISKLEYIDEKIRFKSQ